MTFLDRLDGVELAQVRFHLELHEACAFPAPELMRLRRELIAVAQLPPEAEQPPAEVFLQLLDPPPPVDPLLRRRVQKPSPPFAFKLPEAPLLAGAAGEVLTLEAVLPGRPVQTTLLLARLLMRLGPIGLVRGAGRFRLLAISARGHDGVWTTGWQAGADLDRLSLSLLNLRWLLEEQLAPGSPRRLRFVTPARLLSHGRPLFQLDMTHLAPFLLRRVTAVLACAAAIDPWDDADALLAALQRLPTQDNTLQWSDWRTLAGDAGAVDLGGVTGSLLLPELESEEVEGLLLLAALFNVGRGASFGAGQFRLECGGPERENR